MPLFASTILSSVALAIVASFVQMAVIWILYIIINFVFKPNPTQKFRAAATAVISGLLLFLTTLCIAWMNDGKIPGYHATIISSNYLSHYLLAPANILPIIQALVGLAYLFTITVTGFRLCKGYKSLTHWRNRRNNTVAPIEFRLFVLKHSRLLGITSPVKVICGKWVASPFTIGFWKPVIFLPLALVNHLTIAQTEAILLHELAHIKRHDYLLNIFFQATEVLLFFNPFIRWILDDAYNERELCCDDLVLQFKYNNREYAEALLAIEEKKVDCSFSLCAASEPGYRLRHRIIRIMSENSPKHISSVSVKKFFLAAILALVIPLLSLLLSAGNSKNSIQKAISETQASIFLPNAEAPDAGKNTATLRLNFSEIQPLIFGWTPDAPKEKNANKSTEKNNVPPQLNKEQFWNELAPSITRVLMQKAIELQDEQMQLQQALELQQQDSFVLANWNSGEASEIAGSFTDKHTATANEDHLPYDEKSGYPLHKLSQKSIPSPLAKDSLQIALTINSKHAEALNKSLRNILSSMGAKTPEQIRGMMLGIDSSGNKKASSRYRVIIQL